MAYQLIYTSSPKGLALGRSGFCTVARSSGMPERLAAAIEPLGIYEKPSGAGNPVSYTFSNICFGQTRYYVLTRCMDCGTDYTNRNNYIAHHVILSESEISEDTPNPAEIMLGWNGWTSSWQGEPKLLEDGGNFLNIAKQNNILPAKTWAEIFGDAGKAALLGVQTKTEIRAKEGSEKLLLKLFSESLELELDTQKRWSASFTTCACGGVSSRANWKTVCGNKTPNTDIDLSEKSAPEAPNSRAAEYARTAAMTNREKFNLTVKGPKLGPKKFDVVQTPSEKPSQRAKLTTVAAAVAGAAIAFAALFASLNSPRGNSGSQPAGTHAELNRLNEPEKTESFAQLKERISAEIAKNNFSVALKIWRTSLSAQIDPSYERSISAQIAARFDEILSDAELAIVRGKKTDAEKFFSAAQSALDTGVLPDKNMRADSLEALKRKSTGK